MERTSNINEKLSAYYKQTENNGYEIFTAKSDHVDNCCNCCDNMCNCCDGICKCMDGCSNNR